MFFFAGGNPRESSLDEKSGDMLTIDFGKNGNQIGPGGVRNPHLGSVKEIMFAVGRESRFGSQSQRIGARAGFAEGVRSNPFSGSKFRKILFLLRLCSEIDQRLSANAGVSAASNTKIGRAHV